jgi:hypothetical protein
VSNADPRAAFKGRSDNDLREELDDLAVRRSDLHQRLDRERPTREQALAQINTARGRATARFGTNAGKALNALTNAIPGAPGFREAEQAAITSILASDAFAAMMTEHYANKRPTEKELEPLRDELEAITAATAAITAEMRLRELDVHVAEREAALETLRAAG